MSDIGDWFRSLPIFTRYWFALSIVFPLLGRMGLVSPYYLILNEFFIKKFQVCTRNENYKFSCSSNLIASFSSFLQLWRPVTALFYYPITPQTGFHYLMNLYFLYNYSVRLETGTSLICIKIVVVCLFV